MVVNLNPAISNRSQIAFGKSKSGSTGKSNLAGTTAIKESVPHKSSALGRFARRTAAAIMFGWAALTGCHKDPILTPDIPPVNEKAVLPFMNKYNYYALAVDTGAYPAKDMASTELEYKPTGFNAYNSTLTVNPASTEDTIIYDRTRAGKKDASLKFFVGKDENGNKILSSKNFSDITGTGKLEHVGNSTYPLTNNSIINKFVSTNSSVGSSIFEYVHIAKEQSKVLNKGNGDEVIFFVKNLGSRLKNL